MKIIISKSAKQNLLNIKYYISENDYPEQARETLTKLREAIHSLKQLPNRGTRVRELVELGLNSCREIYCDCYRIIYEVEDEVVNIHLIIDKRRDLVPLLPQNILN